MVQALIRGISKGKALGTWDAAYGVSCQYLSIDDMILSEEVFLIASCLYPM